MHNFNRSIISYRINWKTKDYIKHDITFIFIFAVTLIKISWLLCMWVVMNTQNKRLSCAKVSIKYFIHSNTEFFCFTLNRADKVLFSTKYYYWQSLAYHDSSSIPDVTKTNAFIVACLHCVQNTIITELWPGSLCT